MTYAMEKAGSGYRLRDLLAAVAVIQMGVSYLYMVEAGLASPSLDLAVIFFVAGLGLLIVACFGAAIADRLSLRCPALVVHRRCPLWVLLGIVSIALSIAASDDQVMRWVAESLV